jgi:hypothetical protein
MHCGQMRRRIPEALRGNRYQERARRPLGLFAYRYAANYAVPGLRAKAVQCALWASIALAAFVCASMAAAILTR